MKHLDKETAFRRVTSCPWCGAEGDEHRKTSDAFNSKPNRYLDALAKEIGIPVSEITETMAAHECQICATSFCDPWLSESAAQWLFNIGYSQHHAGWARFFHWLDRSPQNEKHYHPRSVSVWNHIIQRAGPISTYGEVACPFTGLFMYFHGMKSAPQESFNRFRAHCTSQKQNTPWPLYMNRWPSPLPAVFTAKGLKNRSNWRKAPSVSTPPEIAATLPQKLFYFRASSTLSWQASCQALGCSCANMATGNFDIHVTEFSELKSEIDCLCFFNTLDHQDRPLQALEKALGVARVVVVEVHPDDDTGKQHPFAINQALERAAETNGWFLEDFSDEIGVRNRYYLLAREPLER